MTAIKHRKPLNTLIGKVHLKKCVQKSVSMEMCS